MTYRVSEEEDSETKIGFSSEPGQGVIIALKDYDRQFSAHTVSWMIFGAKANWMKTTFCCYHHPNETLELYCLDSWQTE